MALFSRNVTKESKYKEYDTKSLIPQYTPARKKPMLESLVNYDKYAHLIRDIKKSSVTEEEKKFLLAAASRHIEFHYANIADYYAHASPEMQRLMEASALVILDINDAIANGYVTVSKDIRRILEETGEMVGEDAY